MNAAGKIIAKRSAELEQARKQLELLDVQLVEEEGKLRRATKQERAFSEAQQFLQATAAETQSLVLERVSVLVTKCLQSVFGKYEFVLQFDRKRGKTEAQLQLWDGDQLLDPVNSVGGGVSDIIAFALRVVFLFLKRPQPRRLLVLDEPFRFVSVEYRPAVAQLLQELAEELDLQILIVTHQDELKLGTVIHLGDLG